MADDSRRRIEIPEEVARAEHVPDDLDATQREPYTIPTTRRRRTSGAVHLVAAGLAAASPAAGLPSGMWVTAGMLALLGVWHLASAWSIEVLDPEALAVANRETEFAVGHASAAVGFDGWRARPVWNVLVFGADDPPSVRGLVRVDAVDGSVVGSYVEDVSARG
jgi:hypothetical protein